MGKSTFLVLTLFFFNSVLYSQVEVDLNIKSISSVGEIENYKSFALSDLLFLWDDRSEAIAMPWSEDFDRSDYLHSLESSWYGQCKNKAFYNYPVQESTEGLFSVLEDRCKPEFLYSWGTEKKIEDLKLVAGQTDWQSSFLPSISDMLASKNIRVLYMGLTPASTFPYGKTMVRLKIRPDVKFINIESRAFKDIWGGDCSKVPQSVRDSVIVYKYRQFDGPALPRYQAYLEYQACSPKVFESWSHDTKQNYNEIIRDYLWMIYGESWTTEHIAYQYLVDGFSMQASSDSYSKGRFHDQNVDGVNWSKETLVQTLRAQVNRIDQHKAEIFYNPNNEEDLEHYSYSKPIWFLNASVH